MSRERADFADLVEEMEGELKKALEDREKALLEEKALLMSIYERTSGASSFAEKAQTDRTVSFLNVFLEEFTPEFYSSIDKIFTE